MLLILSNVLLLQSPPLLFSLQIPLINSLPLMAALMIESQYVIFRSSIHHFLRYVLLPRVSLVDNIGDLSSYMKLLQTVQEAIEKQGNPKIEPESSLQHAVEIKTPEQKERMRIKAEESRRLREAILQKYKAQILQLQHQQA